MGIGIFQAVGDEGDPKGAEVQIPDKDEAHVGLLNFGSITGGKTDTRHWLYVRDTRARRLGRGEDPGNPRGKGKR